MVHIGVLCPPALGHLNPMTTLGYELQKRGHQITFFGVLDTQPNAVAARLEFCVLGESEYPAGSLKQSLTRLGELDGLAALLYTINQYKKGATAMLQEAPEAIRRAGVEALLIDQTIFEGGTVAEYLRIPFITVCSALMLNPEPVVPPPLTSWDYSPEWWNYLRNQIGYTLLAIAGQPIQVVINEYRKKMQLPVLTNDDPNRLWSELAQISQQPSEFEFPRSSLPRCFHFTGPFSNPVSRVPVSFPFEKLTGQPLIYASLGTVQNRLSWVFYAIAEACEEMNVQLVISQGGSASLEALSKLPGSPLVVEYSPQLEVLKKAALTITHAGMNTVLESLSNGVPLVAIPIANDQPGVAARIAWTGTGEVVPLSGLSASKLRVAIKQVLTDESYRQNATKLQAAIERAGGVSRAADIVEQAIYTRKPVLQ